MQTTTVSLGFLQSISEYLADCPSIDPSSVGSSLKAVADMHLAAAPQWSASLEPLKRLAQESGRPIAGIDIEGTGTNPQEDRIVELVVIRIETTGEETVYKWLLHPNRNIPAEATAVHGITNEDVARAPMFYEVAGEIAEALAGAIVVGFNSNNYDVPLLGAEFNRMEKAWPAPGTLLIDPRVIYTKKDGRGLKDAVKTYCYQDGETAHRAEADAYQALLVLAAQLERYPDLGAMTAQELDAFCQRGQRVDFSGKLMRNAAGQVCFAFGKNQGKAVAEELGYARWMLSGDFPADTKVVLRQELKIN